MSELDRLGLIRILQLAYSGELAAAYAYRGHWASVSDAEERKRIQEIEAEEWHHRELVGELLHAMGAGPSRAREARAWIIGRVLGVLCRLAGWFPPMWAAGKLERRNIVEYEVAARSRWAAAARRSSSACSRWPRSSGSTSGTSAPRSPGTR
jgi:rubrerythrin